MIFETRATNPLFTPPIIAPRSYGFNPITKSGYSGGYAGITDFLKEQLLKFKCEILGDEDSCRKLCYDYKDKDTCEDLCKRRDQRACSIVNPQPTQPPRYPRPQPPVYPPRGDTFMGMDKGELALLLGAGALIIALLALRK